MQNLYIQYQGIIDVIYIDPPYGKDDMGNFANTNYDNNLDRNTLLSSLYPRLLLARSLMTDDGVIFCSIDDKNQAYVKGLMDTVFGENCFLFCAPRITKKGGKSTDTIALNNDYILAYKKSEVSLVFSREDKDISKYTYADEHEAERGKYALSQPLDYNSLQYSETMDYEIELEGQKFYPGGSKEGMLDRHNGNHGKTDWVWRWGEKAIPWGKENDMFVIKNGRIYTKSYLKIRKKRGKNEFEKIDPTKSFTTLSYLENQYSNDNGKKELTNIFSESKSKVFDNPKPSELIKTLIKMVCDKENAIILDFYAGSGTTGQAVLKLNQEEGTHYQFILCTANEITDTTPNGIAYDVTAERLRRVMTGKASDTAVSFQWQDKNKPYGDSLDVYEVAQIKDNAAAPGSTPFDVIDETAYGCQPFTNPVDKIRWVCEHFDNARKELED